ncbi:MAG: LPD23 domain-containing protein [Bacteriovoracaceae bacterium]
MEDLTGLPNNLVPIEDIEFEETSSLPDNLEPIDDVLFSEPDIRDAVNASRNLPLENAKTLFEIQKFADGEGVPFDTVKEDLDWWSNHSQIKKAVNTAFERDEDGKLLNPLLARTMLNPVKQKIVLDDWEKLALLERDMIQSSGGIEDQLWYSAKGSFRDITRGLISSFNYGLAEPVSKVLNDKWSKDFVKNINNQIIKSDLLRAKPPLEFEDAPIRQFSNDVMGVIPQTVLSVGGYVAGGPIGASVAFGSFIFGNSYEQYRELGVDPLRAYITAAGNAVFQGALEAYGINALAKITTKGGKLALKNFINANIKEFTTEWAQAYVEEASRIAATAKDFDGGYDEFVDNLGKTTAQGMYEGLVVLPLSIFGGGAHAYNKYRKYKKDLKQWDKVEEDVSKINIPNEFVYEELNEIEKELNPNDEELKVYINPNAVDSLFQGKKKAVDEFLEKTGVSREEFEKAKENGLDVELSRTNFRTHYSGTDISLALRPHLRFTADGFNEIEVKEINKITEINNELLAAAVEESEKKDDFETPQRVKEQLKKVRERLESSKGVKKRDVTSQLFVYEQIWRHIARTQSPRLGITPEQYLEEKFPDIESIDYASFSGEILEQFAGSRARNADKSALRKAKARIKKGIPREDVYEETGWYQDSAGRWKFELDDSKGKPKSINVDKETIVLEDVIQHDELFKAYPWLKDVEVWFPKMEEDVLGGAQIPEVELGEKRDDAFIIINSSLLKDGNEVRLNESGWSTILHEIQHLIQYTEGFLNGSNPAKETDTQEDSFDVYYRKAGEVEARNTEARRDFGKNARRMVPPWITQDIAEEDTLFQGKDQYRLAKMVNKQSGESHDSKAIKKGSKWEIGGDVADYSKWDYLIAAKEKKHGQWAWHSLKGGRLIFQEFLNDTELGKQKELNTLKQRDGEVKGSTPRGGISFGGTRAIMYLFETADASTFLHETGHFILRDMKELVDLGVADEKLNQDYNNLLKYLGSEDGNLTEAQEEKLARSFEAYLREGKAPSPGLVSAFQTMKDFLRAIYKTLQDLFLEQDISDEVRGIFDRFLASEAEIEEANAYYSIFSTTLDKFMELTKAQEKKIKKAKAARDKDIEKKNDAKYIDAYFQAIGSKKELRKNIKKELLEEKPYQVISIATEMGGFSESELRRNKVTKKRIDWLKKKFPGSVKKDGKASIVDVMLETDTPTKKEVLGILKDTKSINDEVEIRTAAEVSRVEQKIIEDMKGDAVSAVHTEKSLEYLLAEQHILLDKISKKRKSFVKKAELKAIKAAARKLIGQEKINKGSLYHQYSRKEQTAIDKFHKVLKKIKKLEDKKAEKKDKKLTEKETIRLNGYYEQAADLKFEQITYHSYVLEAVKVRDFKRKVAKKYQKSKIKSKLKNVEFDFHEYIVRVLGTYELASIRLNKPDGKARSLEEVTGAYDYDTTPSWLANLEKPSAEGRGALWTKLTYDQLLALDSHIDTLFSLGSDQLKVLKFGQTLKVADFIEKSSEYMKGAKERKHVKKKYSFKLPNGKTISFPNIFRKPHNLMREFLSFNTMMQFMAGRLDGFVSFNNEIGPMRTLFDTIRNGEATQKLRYGQVLKDSSDSWRILGEAIDRIQESMETEGSYQLPVSDRFKRFDIQWDSEMVIAALLNMGNDGNMRALVEGYQLSPEDIKYMQGLVTKKEWAAIQKIWDATDKLFPEINQTHFQLHNRYTPKVEANELVVEAKDGVFTLPGGYYPLIFDHRLSDVGQKAEEKKLEMLLKINHSRAVIRKAHVNDGMTIERVGAMAPPRLDVGVWYGHIDAATRYIALAPIVRDYIKITKNEVWRNNASKVIGEDGLNEIDKFIERMSHPGRFYRNALEKGVEHLRRLSTVGILGMNVLVGLKQNFSIFNAAEIIGHGTLKDELITQLKTEGGIKKSIVGGYDSWVLKKSNWLKARQGYIDREISDLRARMKPSRKKIKIGDRTIPWSEVQNFMFMWIQMNDARAVNLVWKAAYHKKYAELIGKGVTEDSIAIEYADSVVEDTQPSSLQVDFARSQTEEGTIRLFTMFTTFTLKLWNRSHYTFDAYRSGKITTTQLLKAAMNEIIFPTWGIMWLEALARHGGEPPEWWEYLSKPVESLVSGVPIVRDASSFFRYGDPLGASPVFEPINRTVKAVQKTGLSLAGRGDYSDALLDLGIAAETWMGIGPIRFMKEVKTTTDSALDAFDGLLKLEPAK